MKTIEDYYFNITMDFYENIIYVKSLSDLYDNVSVSIEISDEINNLIYGTQTHFQKDLTMWYKPNNLFSNYNYIIVTIKKDNNIIVTEKFRIKDNHNRIIKPILVYCKRYVGIGDFMFSIPFIKKLYSSYQQKMIIIAHHNVEDYLKNCMYMNKYLNSNDVNIDDYMEKYEVFEIFGENHHTSWTLGADQWRLCAKHMNLKDDELLFEYIPDKYINIPELPEKYVCINPVSLNPNRKEKERHWEKEKWQELVNKLNDNNIYVVTIGKETNGQPFYELDIKLGINLAGRDCQNTLSQAWHIINRSDMFITFTSGLYLLSWTTNTFIVQLGWINDPYYQQSYRNGIRCYKYSYIKGECEECCVINLKYNILENNSIKNIIDDNRCVLNIDYICKPQPDKVFNEVLNILKNN